MIPQIIDTLLMNTVLCQHQSPSTTHSGLLLRGWEGNVGEGRKGQGGEGSTTHQVTNRAHSCSSPCLECPKKDTSAQ